MNWIKKELWSPYAAGALLGIVGILTVVLANKLLGASGGFENIVGMIGKAVAPAAFNNMYFNFVMPAEVTYAVMLLIGIFLGGTLGALSSGTFRFRTMDDEMWKEAHGPQVWKRWLLLFLGGVIVQYGAGIAGGCTSGLLISGGMLLAPAAFLFMAGMFVSGIITAKIIYGKRY